MRGQGWVARIANCRGNKRPAGQCSAWMRGAGGMGEEAGEPCGVKGGWCCGVLRRKYGGQYSEGGSRRPESRARGVTVYCGCMFVSMAPG